MNQIQIANLLLTRKCNLRCDYCGLIKNPGSKYYNSLKEIVKNELNTDEWKDIIYRIYSNNPEVFFILYGGEPTLRNDLEEIISYCNSLGVFYTIITNGTGKAFDKLLDISKRQKIWGITTSVDPIILNSDSSDSISKKSESGFSCLLEFQKLGICSDLVAEITVSNSNKCFLYDTVKKLSDNGIYSSITFVDKAKNEFYDFSNVVSDKEVVYREAEICKQLVEIYNDQNLLVHIKNLIPNLYNILPYYLDCSIDKDLHNISLDSDGKVRLCLRIRGPSLQNICYKMFIGPDGTISKEGMEKLKKDYQSCCQGCNWTCMLMSKIYSKQILQH